MHLVGFIIRIYHDKRSPESQKKSTMFSYSEKQESEKNLKDKKTMQHIPMYFMHKKILYLGKG